MPQIGDICLGADLGKTNKYALVRRHIYVKCPECGSERWIGERRDKATPKTPLVTCHFCTFNKTRKLGRLNQGLGDKSPHWKGGRSKSRGYIVCRIYDDNPYYPMAVKAKNGAGGILEHRLVIAQAIGRLLTKGEQVHHKNGDKEDNRFENLELISPANHKLYTTLCSHCPTRIENRKLKAQIKRLTAQLPTML